MFNEKTYGMRFPDASVHLLTPMNPPLSARDILSCNWLVCSLTSFFLFYKEEYDEWRYKYPELDTYQKRAKVPSLELSDYLLKELTKKEN